MSDEKGKISVLVPRRGNKGMDARQHLLLLLEEADDIENIVTCIQWKSTQTTQVFWTQMTNSVAVWMDWVLKQDFIPQFMRSETVPSD